MRMSRNNREIQTAVRAGLSAPDSRAGSPPLRGASKATGPSRAITRAGDPALQISRSFRWQAETRPGAIWTSAGASVRQRSAANGQRGWKWHPRGGSIGDGISPLIGSKLECRVSSRGTSLSNGLGVRMIGRCEQFLGWGRFHHSAQIHDVDSIGDVLDHAEVVADEEIGQRQILTEVHEQIENLCLNGDIERGHRLVADDALGLDREGPRDADAAGAGRLRTGAGSDA